MGRFILSILLAFSASSSFLLAQNESKQGTGCRLQGTGPEMAELPSENPSFQADQRAEITTNYNNQVTGFRLQVAGTNQTTENQIKQQAEPTTNCDNSGENLSCHMMMNPTEIKEGEEILDKLIFNGRSNGRKRIKPKLFINTPKFCNTVVITQQKNQTPTTCSLELFSPTALEVKNEDYDEKEADDFFPVASLTLDKVPTDRPLISDKELEKIGKALLITGRRDAIIYGEKECDIWEDNPLEEESETQYRMKNVAMRFEENPNNWFVLSSKRRDSYNNAVLMSNMARDKAVERKIQNAQMITEKAYRDIENNNNFWTSCLTTSSFKKSLIEAAKKAEYELMRLELEAVERKKAIRWAKFTPDQRSKERKIKAIEAKQATKVAEEKETQQETANSWEKTFWKQASKYWTLAVQEQRKDEKEAFFWQQIAEECEKSLLIYQQIIERHIRRNGKSKDVVNHLKEAESLASEVNRVFTKGISWEAKESEARNNGREEEANLWHHAIQASEKAILFYQGISTRRARGEDHRESNLKKAADVTLKTAKVIAQTIPQRIDWKAKENEAESNGKVEEANLWNQAIQEVEKAIAFYRQSAEQYAQEKDDRQGRGYNLEQAADITIETTKVMKEMIHQRIDWEVKENEAASNGKIEEANLWHQAIQEHEKAIALYQRAEEYYKKRQYTLKDRYGKDKGYYLEQAADMSVRATKVIAQTIPRRIHWKAQENEARSNGREEIADSWYAAIQEDEKSIECYQRKAEQYEQGNYRGEGELVTIRPTGRIEAVDCRL